MSSRYEGRHRGRHRAPKKAWRGPAALSPTFALPTAAATALVVTATGATVAESAPLSIDLSATQAMNVRVQAADAVAQAADLASRRQQVAASTALVQGRAQERQRIARDRARKAAEARKKAAEAAAARAKLEREGKKWVQPFAGMPDHGSGYGMRLHPVLGIWRMHAGNDYPAPTGTPLVAMSKGVVTFAGSMGGYGNKVEITYWDGTVSYYGHMNSISAHVGQEVLPGDVVGTIGSTGISTGAHLHLEIHPGGGAAINPSVWLKAHELASY